MTPLHVCVCFHRELLVHLNKEQLTTLEQALCSAEGLGTLERNKNKAAAARKKHGHAQQQQQTSLASNNSSSFISLASTSDALTSDLPPALPPRSPTRSRSPIGNSRTLTVPVEHHQRPSSAALSPSSIQALSSTDGAAAVSPANPSGQLPRSRSYDLDSRESSRTVFEPIPRPISVQQEQPSVPVSSSGAEGRDGSGAVTVEEQPEFPRLGVDQPVINELPSRRERGTQQTDQQNTDGVITSSCGNSPIAIQASGSRHLNPTTSSGTASPLRLSPAKKGTSGGNSSKPKRNKYKGPAGFPSAEDLMHRLFLGISGVADQLQSNHAKELRVILKHVFTVCQSEPDAPSAFLGSGAGHAGYEENNTLEPCTPEPQSPLIANSQSKHFER